MDYVQFVSMCMCVCVSTTKERIIVSTMPKSWGAEPHLLTNLALTCLALTCLAPLLAADRRLKVQAPLLAPLHVHYAR